MTARWIKLVNGVEVEMTPEEIEARQIEEAIEPVQPLSSRLEQFLMNEAAQLSAAVEAGAEPPPAGTLAGIAQISATLKELARLVPPNLYAPEAFAAITTLGTLPEPLETARQNILQMITEELNV